VEPASLRCSIPLRPFIINLPTVRRLDLHPVARLTPRIWRVRPLRDDTLKLKLLGNFEQGNAMVNVIDVAHTLWSRDSRRAECLPIERRSITHVVASNLQDVEREKTRGIDSRSVADRDLLRQPRTARQPIDTNLPARRIVRALDELVELRGRPIALRVDNGPELISDELEKWARCHGVERRFIQPGRPMQNGYVKRLNRTYREEVLNCYVFETLGEVRQMTAEWITRYNEIRPHESLGNLSPRQYLMAKSP
jgi:putative transposase